MSSKSPQGTLAAEDSADSGLEERPVFRSMSVDPDPLSDLAGNLVEALDLLGCEHREHHRSGPRRVLQRKAQEVENITMDLIHGDGRTGTGETRRRHEKAGRGTTTTRRECRTMSILTAARAGKAGDRGSAALESPASADRTRPSLTRESALRHLYLDATPEGLKDHTVALRQAQQGGELLGRGVGVEGVGEADPPEPDG
jgi:hypothetical protein